MVGSPSGPGDVPVGPGRLVPNHHAHHRGFAGVRGVAAGLTMLIGRGALARLACELTGVGRNDRVIDVGCGPGAAARQAGSRGATVTGVDPAPVMLGLARILTRRPGVSWLEGTAEALPVRDGAATVLWSIATVHHWSDLDAGLTEARRVLWPGGALGPARPVWPATGGSKNRRPPSPSWLGRPASLRCGRNVRTWGVSIFGWCRRSTPEHSWGQPGIPRARWLSSSLTRGARSGTRTRTPLPAKAFEASASTDSAIRAGQRSLPATRLDVPGRKASPVRVEDPPRVAAVHVAQEGRVDVVPEELLKAGRQPSRKVLRHRQAMVLLGPQPAHDVLEDHPQPGTVGAVGATTVEQVAQVHKHGPGRHLGHDHVVVPAWPAVMWPAVAPWHQASGAVGLGEVVQRPHRVDHHRGLVRRERIDTLVAVEHLGRFARTDLDPYRGAQLVVTEDAVEDPEKQWVERAVVERTGLGEQGVHPAGGEPLEVIAPGRGGREDAFEVGPLGSQVAVVEHAFDDDVAVGEKAVDQRLHGDRRPGGAHASDDRPVARPAALARRCG